MMSYNDSVDMKQLAFLTRKHISFNTSVMSRNLDTFLLEAASHLRAMPPSSEPAKHIVVAVGNESADLDSIISSLAFSFLSHTLTPNPTPTVHLPLTNIPRADLQLRPEVVHVLTSNSLSPNNLLFTEGLPHLTPHHTSLVLLDHNRLTAPFAEPAWSSHIMGILDHHVDEELYTTQNLHFRVIKPVGSATSLVLHHFLPAWKTFLTPSPITPSAWSSVLARLMLAPILVDTVNLRSEHGRTTALDVSAAEFLISQVRTTDTAFSPDAYYTSIQKARTQVSHLSTTDLLRKDYKEWTTSNKFRVGISSVSWSIAAWAEREGGVSRLVNGVREFAKERELDLAVVMTGFDKERGFERELVVVVMEERLRQVVVEELEGEGGKMLEDVQETGVAVGEGVGGESLSI
ncbi:hypothetical protein BC938DRAFT_478643 [Jimgerdemannia flammicorona]|uniref:DHHA2 domain-containing protein n=1 Tax=Jimgerdemannia flammicorona TaxID=994334 RepID=A0A433QMJ3_9FUNG|nr:hypothetical protein BC938DRAFT_478643 [Jimgerdemannia flammicorona]